MTARPRNALAVPGVPSALEELVHGRVPTDLLCPFPAQDPADAGLGDEAVGDLRSVFDGRVPAEGEPVDDLVGPLARAGLLHPGAPVSAGGRDLSPYNVFRLVTAAAEVSVPAGLLLAIHNGIGAPAYLRLAPEGPLRAFLEERLAAGAVTAMADTEPAGASNRGRTTKAGPSYDGRGYVLDGHKLYIGNGPIAEVIAVTATLEGRNRILFVDARDAGTEVLSRLEFMGFKGFPNGELAFAAAPVPAERLLPEDDDPWLSAQRAAVLARGRVHVVAGPSLAVARGCLRWATEYLTRRRVDGVVLTDYPQVRGMLAECAADTYALETAARWAMLGDAGGRRVNLVPEQVAAKDITSMAAWRVAERTLTLMAGEGFETAAGKAARGAVPAPVERLFRDARGTRVAGGTEVLLRMRLAANFALTYFAPDLGAPDALSDAPAAEPPAGLSGRNRAHWVELTGQARAFAESCRAAAAGPRSGPTADGHALSLLGELAEELVTAALVLARAAGEPGSQDLADVFCEAAWHRVAAARRQLRNPSGADHAAVVASLLERSW
ncbi:acyl-CoA dehydrogenase family protein [Saccharothrix lopnurensis]|uniref:Acyl-CoA dehydrogenase family protein n=1 Tax=Saccharothrix lopnurensis TaxID=1670621 RepID=A0ABW1PH57_9PSEU